jgi:hypothetical protein
LFQVRQEEGKKTVSTARLEDFPLWNGERILHPPRWKLAIDLVMLKRSQADLLEVIDAL